MGDLLVNMGLHTPKWDLVLPVVAVLKGVSINYDAQLLRHAPPLVYWREHWESRFWLSYDSVWLLFPPISQLALAVMTCKGAWAQ